MAMSYPPYLLAASNTGNTAGNTGTSFGTFVLAGTNNITVSQSTATNNVHTLWLSGAAGGGGGTISAYATSNTYSSSSGTINAASFLVRGQGNASVGISNGSLLVSGAATAVPNYQVEVDVNSTSNSVGNWDAKLTFNGAGIVSVGVSDNALTISATQSAQTIGVYAVSNTTQSSSGTLDARTMSFQGAGGVSVGYSNGSVVISGASGGGGGGLTVASTNIGNDRGWAQNSLSLGQNSLYMQPVVLDVAVSGSAFKVPAMITQSSSAANAQTRGYTARLGVYTRNSTNSTVLSRHYSTSYTASFTMSSNASLLINVITGLGNSTSYNTLSASSAGLNLSASVHGPRELLIPCATTFTAGEYWIGWLQSSSTAGANNNLFNISHIIASSQTVNALGMSTNASTIGIARDIGLGTYSTTTGSIPDAITMTQIRAAATNPILYYGVYTA